MEIVSPRFLICSYSILYRLVSFVANVTRENVLRMIMFFLFIWSENQSIWFCFWHDLTPNYFVLNIQFFLFFIPYFCIINDAANEVYNLSFHWTVSRSMADSWIWWGIPYQIEARIGRGGYLGVLPLATTETGGVYPAVPAWGGTGGNSPVLLQKEGYSHVQLSASERCCSTQGLHTQQIPRHALEGPLHHRESDKENGYRHQRMDEAAWDCRWWSQLEHHRQDPTEEKGGVLRLRKTFKQEIFSSSQKTCK